MHIISCLVILFVCKLIDSNAENDFNQIDSPTIIDTLTFPLVIDELDLPPRNQQLPIKEHPKYESLHSSNVVTQQEDNSRQTTRKSRYLDKQNEQSEFNYSLFEVGESACPNVYCYAKRQSLTNELMFDCKTQLSELDNKDTMIGCHFWRVPSPGTDTNHPLQSKRHGQGFDLRIVLQPATVGAEEVSKTNGIKRLRIGQLKPGILEWIVQMVRSSSKMTLSPVHLTISFIYFKNLGRNDLGNLPTKSHVTRLSLWNPFSWDEDSFIPFIDQKSESLTDGVYTTNIPPYFRLSIFCDYENQNSSFKRLWFPWKSWQLRLSHCSDLYVCRLWYGKYPICDTKYTSNNNDIPMKTFVPSYFISPKSLLNTSHFTRQETGMQILYNNQCQLEPDQSDPVGDLKLDHRGHCWKTDAYKAALDRGMTKTIVPIVVTVPTTPFISTTTSTVPLSVMTSEIVVLSASQTTTEAPVSTSPATATTTTVTANTNTTTATITTTSTTNTAGELKTDPPMLSKSSADSLKPVPANLLSQGKGGQGILMSESLHYSFSDKEISSESAKDISDFKSDSNNTSNAAINQDKPIKETLSIEHLTIGLILLGIVNILLLFCFIMLVLWIRRRTRKNLKHQSSKLREFDKFYQDFTGIDVTGSNGIYETSQYPLLISSISGTYLSESHPKLNVRHNSFPNSSLSRSQNSDTFLPIRNSNNNTSTNSNNYNPDNSNQSQQHLLGRSTSYSSTVWNGSLRNGLNKCSANENTSVLSKMNRTHSKDRWDYPSNGFPAEYNHHTSSTPYSSRQQLQSINSYPYRRDEIKCSSQTFYPPMPSTSSTAVIAAEIIAQKERERKCLYGSRSRLPSEQPSPTQRHEIKRSPTSSYRKHKKRSISSKPPVGVSRKPHTLVFEGDNGSDKNKWPENFKTSLHEL